MEFSIKQSKKPQIKIQKRNKVQESRKNTDEICLIREKALKKNERENSENTKGN